MQTWVAGSSKRGLRFLAEEREAVQEPYWRPIGATNRGDRWFFVFGFEKNERDNITNKELDALRALAEDLLRLATKQMIEAIRQGSLVEVHDET